MSQLERNHFELFGVPASFALDASTLDHAYRRLQADVHPDRFANASDVDKRLAMQRSAHVNEAYRALKDPIERARYILELRGVDAFDETDTRLPLPFLEAQLERRERAAQAADAENLEVLHTIVREVRDELRARQRELEPLIDDPANNEAAKMIVRELRFLAKVVEDVEAMQDALDA
ncbi:MAG TPA: Fe-S protein assembly co-chaperone HscB [Casimicrobiaceae bacterium]|nr:Fe-S protein assembly co-chaperone HscB [Casimicrobiaceae bacterium]